MPSEDESRLAQRPVVDGTHFTYTELHSALLGVFVGVLAAYALSIGFQSAGVSLGSLFVGIVLGVDVGDRLTHGDRVLQREPWYALGAFVAATAATLAVA